MSLAGRLPALDYVKAAAIVAVTVTHALPGVFAMTQIALFAHFLTGFHVPAFLFVSGFLSRAELPVGWRHVAERLKRILPPYFVATAVVWLLGLVVFPTPRKLVFTLVTGAAFGHYYFLPILACCFVLLPILSRLSGKLLIVFVVILTILAEAMWMEPGWRFSDNLFWQIRDPVLQFHLGHFVLGLVACRYRHELARTFARCMPALSVAAGAGIVAFVCLAGMHPMAAAHPVVHTIYTLALIVFIAALTPARPAPAAVRFLSDATLTIYLYHWFAFQLLIPFLAPMPLGLRIPILVGAGLGFASLVVIAGRRLLGSRSRLWLGA